MKFHSISSRQLYGWLSKMGMMLFCLKQAMRWVYNLGVNTIIIFNHDPLQKTLFLLLSKLVFREQFKEQLCSNLCPILCTTLSTNFHKGEKHGNTFLFKSIVHKCYSNIHMEGGCQCQCLNTKKILSVSAFYIVCHKMFVASSAIAGQDLVICIKECNLI